jgi:hypothetical protein
MSGFIPHIIGLNEAAGSPMGIQCGVIPFDFKETRHSLKIE